MRLTGSHQDGADRFAALFSGTSTAAYDRVLLDRGDWLVAPTLGAIVPGWLLVLPRRRVLNLSMWGSLGGSTVDTILGDLTAHLGLRSDEVVWFEHGPVDSGSLTGCGLDHAHLHVLLRPSFTFDQFAECAQTSADLTWICGSGASTYAELPLDSSYMIAGCGDRSIHALRVESAGSQFFRRVIADISAAGAGWNYRTFAHVGNVTETIAWFGQLENACRRGA